MHKALRSTPSAAIITAAMRMMTDRNTGRHEQSWELSLWMDEDLEELGLPKIRNWG